MRGSITRKLGVVVAALALPVLAIGTAGASTTASAPRAKQLATSTLNGSGSTFQLVFNQVVIGAFKPVLADALVALLSPLRTKLEALRRDEAAIDAILDKGAARAAELAAPTLAAAYRAVGLKH